MKLLGVILGVWFLLSIPFALLIGLLLSHMWGDDGDD